ncbi:pitrilysin family protein [Streptomyces sp. NPDC005760]|uniref:M16 family metallopeptidase n=1 Tax=Streptomyces sp. NPDC005760 TaxID=3156718 RepID=UPI0033D8EB1D
MTAPWTPDLRTYPNGARSVALHRPGSGLVCAVLAVSAGSATEPPHQPGCAHFAEHAFFAGSARFPTAAVVAEVIGALGGVFDAVTHRDHMLFHIKAPASAGGALLELLGDLRAHTLLSPGEMDRQRTAVRHEIKAAAGQPQRAVRELAGLALYGDTPVGRSPLGDPDVVDRLTTEDALSYLRGAAGPGRSALVVVGDIAPDRVHAAAEAGLGTERPPAEAWSRSSGSFVPPVGLWRETAAETVLGCWSVPACGYLLSHREMQCMRLFNTVLGGSASSRLSRVLRDELGLTYRARSVLEPLADVGALLVLFNCDSEGVSAVLDTVRRVLSRLLDEGVSEREIARARALVKGVYAREREDSHAHARLLALELFRRGRFTSQDAESELLESLTAAEVVEVARQVLAPEQGRCAVVGPRPPATRLTEPGHPWRTAPATRSLASPVPGALPLTL